MTIYSNNKPDSVETIDLITDNRTYYFTQPKTYSISDKITPFKGLKVCRQFQNITNYGVFGNALECQKIIFVNSNNELESTIIPEINGNYAFYTKNPVETYDVIFITNNNIKNNILYRNVKPIDISSLP